MLQAEVLELQILDHYRDVYASFFFPGQSQPGRFHEIALFSSFELLGEVKMMYSGGRWWFC